MFLISLILALADEISFKTKISTPNLEKMEEIFNIYKHNTKIPQEFTPNNLVTKVKKTKLINAPKIFQNKEIEPFLIISLSKKDILILSSII